MGLKDEVENAVHVILAQPWAPRTGVVVPDGDSIALRGKIVEIEATVLFADLAQFTALIQGHLNECSTNVIRRCRKFRRMMIRFLKP